MATLPGTAFTLVPVTRVTGHECPVTKVHCRIPRPLTGRRPRNSAAKAHSVPGHCLYICACNSRYGTLAQVIAKPAEHARPGVCRGRRVVAHAGVVEEGVVRVG